MCMAQSLWAWRLLRDDKALGALTSDSEKVREKHAGWVLDGVLVAPLWLLSALWLVTNMKWPGASMV